MSDPTAIDQLSRQLVGIMGNSNSTNLLQVGQCLTKFWAADTCWLWLKSGQAVVYNDRSDLSAAQLYSCIQTAIEGETLEVAGYQIMWLAVTEGQVAVAKLQGNWTTVDQENFRGVANLLALAFTQNRLQQQIEISKQSILQVQAVADERMAQLKSSQNLLSKLQDANRRRIKQLDESNKIKDEFISSISHELRTPLTSMSLAIKMLHQPDLDEARRTKYLEILEQQCTQEINLINDLLTLQQLESKELEYDRQLVNLSELVQPLLQKFQSTWSSKQLQLQVELPNVKELQVDPDSIRRILQELLTNAGKFAKPQTTVDLQIIADDFPEETLRQQLQIRVINQGPIITSEEQTYIFQKFRRGQGVTQGAIAGTGLGLALVKSLVLHLQGEITVSSQPLLAEQAARQDADQQLAVNCFDIFLPLGAP
jgi:signal transduction histidine kinase